MADLFSEAPTRGADVKIRSFAMGGPPRNLQPVMMVAPSLSRALIYDQVICNPGSWDGYNIRFGYQWIRDASTVIADATDATYVVTYADKGHTLKCQVTAMNVQRSVVFTTATTGTINGISVTSRFGGAGSVRANSGTKMAAAARFAGRGALREYL
jgi:hypothetical protein